MPAQLELLTEPLDPKRFCIYCQYQFATRAYFERHIYRKHNGTYAYWALKQGRI